VAELPELPVVGPNVLEDYYIVAKNFQLMKINI
jgi:hypothetical protein